ncbi:lytic transglycosylase domain-containing protein [Nostoc linckia]|uniref:lytic transglycosylase domain-containing protein n=1 Tax=Nostoc linckia TaxID=92942 RepID=UPI000BFFC720|nr:lytic transglycosylase domain-containing protein [Nostoc linckia]
MLHGAHLLVGGVKFLLELTAIGAVLALAAHFAKFEMLPIECNGDSDKECWGDPPEVVTAALGPDAIIIPQPIIEPYMNETAKPSASPFPKTRISSKDCKAAIQAAEREYRIPHGLLMGMGAVESSFRHDAVNVNAADRSVDRGCLQINSRWHANAFKRKRDAFDARLNADYAARYLVALKEKHGSWWRAVQCYNSCTMAPRNRYAEKVWARWAKYKNINLASK